MHGDSGRYYVTNDEEYQCGNTAFIYFKGIGPNFGD